MFIRRVINYLRWLLIDTAVVWALWFCFDAFGGGLPAAVSSLFTGENILMCLVVSFDCNLIKGVINLLMHQLPWGIRNS